MSSTAHWIEAKSNRRLCPSQKICLMWKTQKALNIRAHYIANMKLTLFFVGLVVAVPYIQHELPRSHSLLILEEVWMIIFANHFS